MTNQEFFDKGPATKLDNTMRTEFHNCNRRRYWSGRGYTYKYSPTYFTAGTTWHEFQEKYYLNTGKLTHKDRMINAIAAAEIIYETKIGSGEPNKNDSWDNLRNLMIIYANFYPQESWTMISGETGWIWPLDHTHWYGGSLDGYIEWPQLGLLAIENKSTGSWLSANYLNQWAHAPQITGIIWGLSKVIGEDIFGCMMNMANKTISGPKSKRTTSQFMRRLERRSPAQLEEFEQDVLHTFKLIEMEYDKGPDKWTWHKTVNPIECVGGPGRTVCLFENICNLPVPFTEIEPLDFSHITLRTTEWTPWERTGGQE